MHCQAAGAYQPAQHDDAVLIVEDERISGRALASLLQSCGYCAQLAGSAEDALRQLDHKPPPKIVLVDVDLPGMSGLELVAALEKRRPDLFPILITAAEGDRIHRFLREHMAAYVRKPLNFDYLLRLLDAIAEHPRTRMQAPVN
jgi:DNA-binding NtrC family response regulator